MREKPNRLSFFILIAMVFAGLYYLILTPSFAQGRRVDGTTLEVDMANRLEAIIEKIIGKDRCMVKVNLVLSQAGPSEGFESKYLRGLPGVAYPEYSSENSMAKDVTTAFFPLIKTIAITIYLDNKLPQDKIEQVKASIPKWMELNFARGDNLKIELIPWREIPPEDIAVKQLSFLERNLWVIFSIAGIAILGLILFLLLFLPTRKFIKDRAKIKPEEAKKTLDIEPLLNDLKDTLSKMSAASPAKIDKSLEDIKNSLAKTPTNTDSLLEEIKDTLGKMAETQAVGGGGGTGTGSGAASPEFINALKEAIAPATGGAASGGMSPDVLKTLQKIQDLMKQQVETTATGVKVLDEPFKFLNTLTPKEISLYIDRETPRIAGIILGHVDPNKAADIISSFADEKKVEIAIAMASLLEDDKVATEMKDFIQRKMPQVKLRADFIPIVGNKALANILSTTPYNVTTLILENIERKNSELAEAVKNEMFLFEDIARLDNKTMQEIIKTLDKDKLAIALSRTSDKIRQRFFTNMTENSATILKEDIEALQPSSKEEQKKITMFEDIVNLDNKIVQKIFKAVDKNTLKIALKGTSDEIREKIYSMMTERAAAMLKEDIDVMPPILRNRVEEAHKAILDEIDNMEKQPSIAQKEIIEKILELEKVGRISIRKKA